MSLGKARQFVKQACYDKQLRMECNRSDSKLRLLQKLGFNEVEFEDAVTMQLVSCQTYEEADIVQQIRIWFSLL